MHNMIEIICFIAVLKRSNRPIYDENIQSIMKEREGIGAKIERYPFPIVPIKWSGQIQYEDTNMLCRGLWGKLNLVTKKEYKQHHQAVLDMAKKKCYDARDK